MVEISDLLRPLSDEELKRVIVPSSAEIYGALEQGRRDREAARNYLVPHARPGDLYYR